MAKCTLPKAPQPNILPNLKKSYEVLGGLFVSLNEFLMRYNMEEISRDLGESFVFAVSSNV
jgi:hypothetical protein